MILAGVVAFADRSIRRHLSEQWRRRIHIIMPVGAPGSWSQPAIQIALQDSLGFLTGDAWSFEFTKRKEALPRLKQCDLDLGDTNTVVVPFSNGMDSFAQSKLLKDDGFACTPIRVTAANSSVVGNRDWIEGDAGIRYRRVSIPFRIRTLLHAEPSYRTRTFVFAVMSGIASHLARSSCIVIPEAGQGSFGPSLVPVGVEAPHRGSHPGFTRRMSRLFEVLWNEKVKFRHPQLWRTKGQVLIRLKELNLENGWLDTHSCSQGPRQIHTARHKAINCGLCSGCLLRRMSVFSAGFHEPDDHYFWADLTANSLEQMICADARRSPSKNDRDIAAHALMGMEMLARASDSSRDNLMIKQSIFEAFDDSEAKDAEPKLRELLLRHAREWRAFMSSLGPDAWVNQQIARL